MAVFTFVHQKQPTTRPDGSQGRIAGDGRTQPKDIEGKRASFDRVREWERSRSPIGRSSSRVASIAERCRPRNWPIRSRTLPDAGLDAAGDSLRVPSRQTWDPVDARRRSWAAVDPAQGTDSLMDSLADTSWISLSIDVSNEKPICQQRSALESPWPVPSFDPSPGPVWPSLDESSPTSCASSFLPTPLATPVLVPLPVSPIPFADNLLFGDMLPAQAAMFPDSLYNDSRAFESQKPLPEIGVTTSPEAACPKTLGTPKPLISPEQWPLPNNATQLDGPGLKTTSAEPTMHSQAPILPPRRPRRRNTLRTHAICLRSLTGEWESATAIFDDSMPHCLLSHFTASVLGLQSHEFREHSSPLCECRAIGTSFGVVRVDRMACDVGVKSAMMGIQPTRTNLLVVEPSVCMPADVIIGRSMMEKLKEQGIRRSMTCSPRQGHPFGLPPPSKAVPHYVQTRPKQLSPSLPHSSNREVASGAKEMASFRLQSPWDGKMAASSATMSGFPAINDQFLSTGWPHQDTIQSTMFF